MPVITHQRLSVRTHVRSVLASNGFTLQPAPPTKGRRRFKRDTSEMLVYIRHNELVIRANGDPDVDAALGVTLLAAIQPFGDEITIHLYL